MVDKRDINKKAKSYQEKILNLDPVIISMITEKSIIVMVDELNSYSRVMFPQLKMQLNKESILMSYRSNPNYALQRLVEFKEKLEQAFKR